MITRRLWTILLAASLSALLSVTQRALAQDMLVTNLADLAEQAFGLGHNEYVPFSPWEWHAYSLDGGLPYWVDCSALPCIDLLPASSSLKSVPLFVGVLTKNVLTGEAFLQSQWSTNILAQIPAPSGYQPGALAEDRYVWWLWQQWTNYPDSWGVPDEGIVAPTVTLKVLLADAQDKPAYDAVIVAEDAAWEQAQAEAEAMASSVSGFTAMTQDEGGAGGFETESVCTITNETAPFFVTSIVHDTNGYTTVTWQSCSDHIYGVLSTDQLGTSTIFTGRAAMWGLDGSTSWTDTTTTNINYRFYRIVRMPPDGDFDGDGLSNAFELQYGLDPLNSFDAAGDLDGDGYSNWDEFLMGTNPTATNDLVTVYVDSMNTNGVWDGTQAHPFRYIQDAMQCSVSVNSNLAIRVRPGNYYETVSNGHFDFYGNLLSKRKFVYIYAATTNWALATDPETHIIDSSGLPNGDVLGNTNAYLAPAVQFWDVTRARIDGFMIRGGKGLNAGGLECISTQGVITVSNCIVEKNGDPNTSTAGGIWLWTQPGSLVYNTVVTKNVGQVGGILDMNGSRLWNCTIIGNQNTDADLGAVSGYFYQPNIRNSVVWGNIVDLFFADADYSTFASNEFVTAGAHNRTNDPILVNAAFGNYRLQTNSPMIAAGTNLGLERRDLYGNSRPLTSGFDIGANEFTDGDGDGMQDDWETKRSLNPFGGGDATADPDGDGLNNLQEYNHNSDPHNSDTDGDGIRDDLDSDPTTPEELITIEFHDPLHQSVWKYWVNQENNPGWINQPPTQPRVIKLNNYHIGDRFAIQLSYDSGVTNTIYFLVPLESAGAFSVVPDANATPVFHLTDSATLGFRAPPDPGWLTTVWRGSSTNAVVCAGFDDELPQLMLPLRFDPSLSVPQAGTNTFTVVISPASVVTQVIFKVADPSVASVSPAIASTATQVVSVAGLATTNAITSTTLSIDGYGAQNSYTTLTSRVDIDVLPRATNVTVAPHLVIASNMTGTPPTGMPSTSVLKSYLDTVYGKQANVFMTVLQSTTNTVNYDLDAHGSLNVDGSTGSLTAEETAITNAVYTPGAINIYYVNVLTNIATTGPTVGKSYRGITYPGIKVSFIQDVHQQSSQNLTAHEIGYSLGLFTVGPGFPYSPGHIDRLMWFEEDASDPCRLISSEWQKVNINARSF